MKNKEEFNFKSGWKNNPEGEGVEAKTPFKDFGTERLDPERYYSKEFMKLEWDNVWTKKWLLVCNVNDISNIGDFYNFKIGKESIIVIRSSEKDVNAFYNVCPHRGNRLINEDLGFLEKIGCSFHSWVFDLDGNNEQVLDKETFRKEVLDYDLNLSKVRCEIECGFVWITMNDKAEPVREYLGPVATYLDNYKIEEMKVVRHVNSLWKANWKTGLEAFYETYHLSTVHPETQPMMEDYKVQIDNWGNGMNRMIVPFIIPSVRYEDRSTVNESTSFLLEDVGISSEQFNGNIEEAKREIQIKKREISEKFNLGYERYTDAELTDSFDYGIFPNIQIGCHPEGIFLFKFLPHPTDPEKFYLDTTINYRVVEGEEYNVPAWMGLPEDTDKSGKIRPEIVYYDENEKPDLGLILEQDSELIPYVQSGIRSEGFRGALWSEQELRIRHFHYELNNSLKSN